MLEGARRFLTSKRLAEALGVSESSLKRWADEGLLRAGRTAGGHRRIAVADAVRFVRERRVAVLHPEALGFSDVDLRAASSVAISHLDEALFDAFVRDDQPAARGLLAGAFLGGESVAALCDGPIRGALERLGELWKEGPSGIVLEHRAVVTNVQTMGLMRATVPLPSPGSPIALGGAIAGDPYVLPSMAAALVLAEAGYVEVNLGADVPTGVLVDAIGRYRPTLVWRTMSTGENTPMRADVAALAERLREADTNLVVGGRATTALTGLDAERVHLLASMTELAAFARGLLAARRGTPDASAPIGE